MSEKPQQTREDEQEDLLDQIITQGLEKMKATAQTAADEEALPDENPPAPRQEDSGKAAPPAGTKNRRSAVYLYLLILFGAAFLMLLLAYFVQQRSNESTISDLKDSMNLSRQELLDEIKALEGQVDELQSEIEDWTSRYSQMKEQAERYEQQSTDLSAQYNTALSQLSGWKNYWLLEQSYQAGEYEDCVAILLLENMSEFGSEVPPGTFERREEIVQALIDRGFLPEDGQIRISDYEELMDRYLAEHPEFGPAVIIFD